MNRKTCFATIFVAVLCLLTSGCFSIEQEIFLEPDGSGDLVIYVSVPDIPPEATKKDAPVPLQNPQKLLDEIKQKLATGLPPAIKLKEAKEVRRYGVMAIYVVLHFNQLKDVDSIFDGFKESLYGKGQAQSPDSKDELLWKIQMEKAGGLTVITERFYFGAKRETEVGKPESAEAPSDPPPPSKSQASVTPKSSSKPVGEGSAPKEVTSFASIADDAIKGLAEDKETMSMLLSLISKFRFVLHAPKEIIETNADIVLNGKIAIWNAPLGAFVKEKKPIEMKMTY